MSRLWPKLAFVIIRPGPGESVKLRENWFALQPVPPQVAGSREAGGHLDLPPAGLAPAATELSGMKSLIGIPYPEIKFSLGAGCRQENPASLAPERMVDEGRAMGRGRRAPGILVMAPAVKVTMKKKMFFAAVDMIK